MPTARTPRSSSYARLSDTEREQIVRYYVVDGFGFNKISRLVHRNYATIRRVLLAAGVTIRGGLPGPLTEPKKDAIVAGYAGGMNAKQVAASQSLHPWTVRAVLAERGVEARTNAQTQAALHSGGHHHIPCDELGRKRRGALDKDIPWKIGVEDIEAAFARQRGLCFYTDLPMVWAKDQADYNRRVKRNPLALSIDRRDSALVYTPENIALCCRWVNYGKHSYSEAAFTQVLQQAAETLSRAGNVEHRERAEDSVTA